MRVATDRFELRRAAGKALLVGLDAPRFTAHPVFELNDTGAYLWERLAHGDDPDAVAEGYACAFGVSADCAREDLAGFLDSMRSIGAVQR